MEPLHPSLLSRLSEDSLSAESALAAPSASPSIPLVREAATRRLLIHTPRALDRLADIMEYGEEKTAVSAARTILEYSPAVLSEQKLTAVLPPEAITALAQALSSLAQAALNSSGGFAPDASLTPAPEPTARIIKKRKPISKPFRISKEHL
ncbi:MAG: hypothetical protein HC888_12725 [Candidatus Competibacteraceae bacterium]|nr:hypothetical protein [Candidatus Competibacteraceae bacterium]